jgi:hypothetical protein
MVLILLIGLIATYTGFVYGQYKLRYPHIHSMADAGEQMLGSWGREVFGVAQLIFFLFVMASHILTFSIMMNTITMHGSCTIVFGLIGTIICFLFTLPRKLGSVSYMSIASFLSITAAVMVTMIGVGIENPQASEMELFANPSLHNAILATLNIIFAYAGHVAYFGFISELKDPASYPKALILLQGVDTTMYLLVAVITYRYAGPSVASPALGSTGPLLQKISYGIAIPTIVIAGVINGHVAAKYIYVRMFRGTDVMAQNSFKSWGSWVLIGFALWFISWLIAEAVPIFNDLLELISAMLATLCTFSASASFWLYMNRGQYSKNWRKLSLCVVNVLLFLIGLAIVRAPQHHPQLHPLDRPIVGRSTANLPPPHSVAPASGPRARASSCTPACRRAPRSRAPTIRAGASTERTRRRAGTVAWRRKRPSGPVGRLAAGSARSRRV